MALITPRRSGSRTEKTKQKIEKESFPEHASPRPNVKYDYIVLAEVAFVNNSPHQAGVV
jgi:hypothetical protein